MSSMGLSMSHAGGPDFVTSDLHYNLGQRMRRRALQYASVINGKRSVVTGAKKTVLIWLVINRAG